MATWWYGNCELEINVRQISNGWIIKIVFEGTMEEIFISKLEKFPALIHKKMEIHSKNKIDK